MCTINCRRFRAVLAWAVLAAAFGAALAWGGTTSVALGGLVGNRSGNDFVLSFPSVLPNWYTVETRADLQQPWTRLAPGIAGDGTVKVMVVTNGIAGQNGFYRLQMQTPVRLQLSQGAAFEVLGYSCGGIQENVYVTGFEPVSGYPTGIVHLTTRCSTGKAGSPPAVHTAWAAATWDFSGNTIFATAVSNQSTIVTNFIETDAYADSIYNLNAAAYLVVPIPPAPTGVTATQSGEQLQVSWTPNRVNPAAIASSILTATPVNSSNSTLTTTVPGTATSGVIPSTQPQTTYEVSVVSTTVAGSSPPSAAVRVTTSPASIPPSAPGGIIVAWANPEPTGTTDVLVANWQAPNPGNSSVDQYLVTISGSDGAGTFSERVPGTSLTAHFDVDYIPNWSVTVQAHNAAGWGPISSPVTLGGL